MKLSIKGCSILIIMILSVLTLSSCSDDKVSRIDNSIVMVKNAGMSAYGTGFAIGKKGEKVDTVITTYNTIATHNGARPTTAEVRINETNKKLTANVQHYDVARNIAILKLSDKTDELKPVVLKDKEDLNEMIYVRGYDGTGNIMSDFEKFNTTDIVQYKGSISAYDEINTMVVYKYSNEFGRAAVGSPAVDREGNTIGMCSYSLSNMNTYSQYILSSDEIIDYCVNRNAEFVTTSELFYKKVMTTTIIAGVTLLIAVVAFFTLYVYKFDKSKRR